MNSLFERQNWIDMTVNAANEVLATVARFLPKLVGAFAILFVGWLVAILVRRLIRRLVSWTGVLAIAEKHGIDESFQKAGTSATFADVVAGFAFWLTMILVLVSATETLGWTVVSATLRDVLGYTPHLLGAMLVLVLAILVSKVVNAFALSLLSELHVPFKESASRVAGGLVVFVGVLLAIDQVGIDLSFLMANVHLLIGGLVAAFVVSFGIGCKGIVANLVSSFYTRQIYQEGQEVFLGNKKVRVKSLNDVSVVFETESGDIIVPNNQLLTKSNDA